MKWYHKCDIEWLKARQNYLTATDVKDLLPVTRLGNKRKVEADSYLKVLARKRVKITDDMCESTGAAARGHILEPYAIDLFNANTSPTLYHWDDTLIVKSFKQGSLAFSPDAMSIKQSGMATVMQFENPLTVIGEVKSYYPEKHLLCGNTHKDMLEERWQLATAMAVSSDISEAYLLFYNPSMEEDKMYVVEYQRHELEDEIGIVLDIEDKWLTFLDNLQGTILSGRILNSPVTEEDIVKKIMKEEELDPIKTVML